VRIKKSISLFLVLCLIMSLVIGVSGCSSNNKEQVKGSETEQANDNKVVENNNGQEENADENKENIGESTEENAGESSEGNIDENTEEKDTNEVEENVDTSTEEDADENIEENVFEGTEEETETEESIAESNDTGNKDAEHVKLDTSDMEFTVETITFVDGFGKKQTINKHPKRVACLYNSFADVWHSVGGDIIGRIDSETNLPKSYLDAEVVGSMGGINVEKLLSLQPDLVIMASNIDGQTQIRPILEQNNIQYMCLQYESVEEYLKTVKLFSEVLGNEEMYNQIGEKVRNDVNSVIAKVPKDKHPSVLLLFSSARSVSVKTQSSTVGSMLEDLGAINIAYDPRLTEDQMETFSMERVIQEDPDYILLQTMGDDLDAIFDRVKQEVESSPAWSALTAVKEGRYIVLPKDLYLYKANERYGQAYDGLARILYPEDYK